MKRRQVMSMQEFNAISDHALNSLRIDDFDRLLKAANLLRKKTIVSLRENDKYRVHFIGLVGEHALLQDTALTHRMFGRSGKPPTVEVNLYDVVAVKETRFGSSR